LSQELGGKTYRTRQTLQGKKCWVSRGEQLDAILREARGEAHTVEEMRPALVKEAAAENSLLRKTKGGEVTAENAVEKFDCGRLLGLKRDSWKEIILRSTVVGKVLLVERPQGSRGKSLDSSNSKKVERRGVKRGT